MRWGRDRENSRAACGGLQRRGSPGPGGRGTDLSVGACSAAEATSDLGDSLIQPAAVPGKRCQQLRGLGPRPFQIPRHLGDRIHGLPDRCADSAGEQLEGLRGNLLETPGPVELETEILRGIGRWMRVAGRWLPDFVADGELEVEGAWTRLGRAGDSRLLFVDADVPVTIPAGRLLTPEWASLEDGILTCVEDRPGPAVVELT